MMRTRRQIVCGLGLAGMAAALGTVSRANSTATQPRRYRFAHVDVFTQQPLLGNPLDVFLDARGLSDTDMLAITRETYLNEATFVFPREAAVEQKQGVRVRICVEMKRNSDIFVRAGLEGDNIVNIRVGGYAVQSMEGELSL